MEDGEGTACDNGRWVAAVQDEERIPLYLPSLGHAIVVTVLVD
jgi:hypothetical protein